MVLNFVNKAMKEFTDKYNMTHERTPNYSPQCNPVKRQNCMLKTMIRQYLEDRAGNWDKFLPELCFAYNSSLHDATNFTPVFLNFGREIHAKYITTPDSEINIQNLVTKINNLHKVHDLAIHNQENDAKKTDQGRFQCPFKVGDRFFC